MTMKIVLNEAHIRSMMTDVNGAVARDNTRRATNVQLAARRQVGVRSGRLRRSIVKRGPISAGGRIVSTVGSDLDYSLLHHDGTRAHQIVPVNAKVLHFKVGGADVFTMHVNHPGTAPNRYLTDNLREALR